MDFIVTEEELSFFVKKILLSLLMEHKIFLLYGQLGVGKSTLVRALARELGIKEGITSPTFGYVNRYACGDSYRDYTLNHFDLYRLHSLSEFVDAGFDDIIHEQNQLSCIEWPEPIESHVAEKALRIRFSYANNDFSRRIISLSV